MYCHLFLPIGKVQWRRCHQNSSKNRIRKSDDSGILQEYWWETLVANPKTGILQEFRSEFCLKIQITHQMTAEFLWNFNSS